MSHKFECCVCQEGLDTAGCEFCPRAKEAVPDSRLPARTRIRTESGNFRVVETYDAILCRIANPQFNGFIPVVEVIGTTVGDLFGSARSAREGPSLFKAIFINVDTIQTIESL